MKELIPLTKSELQNMTTEQIINKAVEYAQAKNFSEDMIQKIKMSKKKSEIEELMDFLMEPTWDENELLWMMTTL